MRMLGVPAQVVEGGVAGMVAARLSGEPVTWPAGLAPTEQTAYELQQLRLPLLAAAGLGEPVGYKIGATTAAMRALLGLAAPCSGRLFASGVLGSGGAFASARPVGVECEIVVWLGDDLPCPSGACSVDDARAAVAACGVAIEIVENRYLDFRASGAPLLIADDFFAAGCVLGEQRDDYDPTQLDAAVGTISVNGQMRSRGVGCELMGHPLAALAWLAAQAGARGHPLRKGEFVLLGSLTEPQWLNPGDEVRAEVEPLGAVTVRLAPKHDDGGQDA